MIPARLKAWILVWTPLTWLILSLCTYPKDRTFSTGVGHVLAGFASPTVARYPAWIMAAAGIIFLAYGVIGFVRRKAGVVLRWMLVATGVVFLAWMFWAGDPSSFSLTGRHPGWNWLFQLLAVVACGACVWTWGSANPDRASLTVWNTRQIWKLFRSNWQGRAGLSILIVIAAMALLAPFLANHAILDPTAIVGTDFHAPTSHYYMWLGTDQGGQSVLAEFIWSARISLIVGLLATVISTVLGAGIGIAAGYYGGWSGEVWMRVTDVFLVIPWLPLAMVLAAMLGQNYWMIILIIGVTSWPGTARVVRSDVLRVRELQFVERARAIGSSNAHIMNKHILPNVFPLIFANTILVVAIAILSETELSFLGLGDPLNFSWGTMLRNAWLYGAAGLPAWWYLLPPGIAIILIVVAFTFMGTAFDEVLDPRLRKREEAGSGAAPKAASLNPAAVGAGDGVEVSMDAAEGINSETERGGQP